MMIGKIGKMIRISPKNVVGGSNSYSGKLGDEENNTNDNNKGNK